MIRKILLHPKWQVMTSTQRGDLLETLSYIQYGEILRIKISYNHAVFYSLKTGEFKFAMGLFLPSFEHDLADRNIYIHISPVLLELLLT